jgi:hypothetical protein
MQTKALLKCVAASLMLLATTLQFTAFGQGTAFTYQGALNDGAYPAEGTFDLTFTLYDASSGGSSIAGPVTNSAVVVSNGLFTTSVDFGGGVFTSASKWLGIGVRTNAVGSFAPLTPRQRVTPTPYAIFAEGASAAGLNGTIPAASLSGTYNGAVTFNNAANSFTGNGAGLTSLSAGNVSSGTLADTRLSSNVARLNASQTFSGQNNFQDAGASSGSLHVGGYEIGSAPKLIYFGDMSYVYLGESGADDRMELRAGQFYFNNGSLLLDQGLVDTAGSTLEFRVNGTRALRLDQGVATNGAPNLIGGSVTNWVDAASYGSTIAGGGATNWGGSAYVNRIVGNFGTIGGGMDNSISNNASYATIAGGYHHSVQNATGASIGGGYGNSIKTSASYGTIAGGYANVIQTNADYATVGGGNRNTLGTGSMYSVIGGGSFNVISNVSHAVIPGGYQAAATHYGQFAFASGDFASPGDAQTSMYVLRSQFSGSAYSSLYLDNLGQMLTVPNGAVWGFEIMVVGSLSDGPSAVFKFTGAIRNYGGTVAFIGTPTKTAIGADAAAGTWDVAIGANYGALDIQAKGNNTGYVSWVATVRTTEVTPNL